MSLKAPKLCHHLQPPYLSLGRWCNKNSMLVNKEPGAEGTMLHFPGLGPGAFQAYKHAPVWHGTSSDWARSRRSDSVTPTPQQREEKAPQCAQAAQHGRLAEPKEADTGIKRRHILGLLTGDHGKTGGTDGRCQPMTVRTREDKSWLGRCQ